MYRGGYTTYAGISSIHFHHVKTEVVFKIIYWYRRHLLQFQNNLTSKTKDQIANKRTWATRTQLVIFLYFFLRQLHRQMHSCFEPQAISVQVGKCVIHYCLETSSVWEKYVYLYVYFYGIVKTWVCS